MFFAAYQLCYSFPLTAVSMQKTLAVLINNCAESEYWTMFTVGGLTPYGVKMR